MSKRAVRNAFYRPLMDILIVYNKKGEKKTGDKIFMAKTRSNTGENGSRITWIFMYINILALIDTDFVVYVVTISTSMTLACTL